MIATTYLSIADGSIGTQRTTAYQFECVDNTQGMWMAATPEIPKLVSDSGNEYKGLTKDPREFYNIAGDIIDAFQPKIGDIITLTADALGGTKVTGDYIVATNGTYELTWAAAANS